MRAISLWQPWATAVALRLKHIETRHWTTRYRGPLAIHAAKRWDREQRELCYSLPVVRNLDLGRIPLGAIVCVVNLAGIQPTEQLRYRVTSLEEYWGNYADGRFGWLFDNVRALAEPVPFKGAQGFFNVPDELLELRCP